VSAAAPWSVKGIEPKAREIAKDLARRSGMTLGEWLNQMILDDEDDGVTPLPRRHQAVPRDDRRARLRRLDDAYGRDETLDRVAASVEMIAERLEASERRSTTAITGVDQAVSGLVHRLDNVDEQFRAHGRRIDDIAEELREGHRRLRRFETDTGPQTTEAFKKVETALGTLAGRFYDLEERQRTGFIELRGRADKAEDAVARVSGSEILSQVGARLDAAQARTTDALRALEQSFAGLDQRMRAAESRPRTDAPSDATRFEKLAETLSRQVETNRAEMMRRLDSAAAEGRIEKIERAVLAIGEQVQASERRSAQAVETMGKEVLRIAQNLNQRMIKAEDDGGRRFDALGQEMTRRVEQDMVKLAQGVEQRLIRSEDRHALAIEKLGGEITRISDRLTERITESERRSTQALDDIGERLKRSSDKIEQQYDRASGELAERMRQSEERTAKLLAEARESIEKRVGDRPAEVSAPVAGAEPDWRAAAFPDAFGDEDPMSWPGEDLGEMEGEAQPTAAAAEPFARLPMDEPVFAQRAPEPEAPAAPSLDTAAAESPPQPPAAPAPQTFGGFGGVDVSDALAREDDFSAETEFVASGPAQRLNSTRDAISAARAAMAASEPEQPSREGFGLKRGGKSRLQERMDRQSRRDGGTVKKAFLASVAVAALAGAVFGYTRLTDASSLGPRMAGDDGESTLLAAALLPDPAAAARPAGESEAEALYEQARAELAAGDEGAVETLTRAANLGHSRAQMHLGQLYDAGENGVPQNAAEARVWIERAAQGGEVQAMHNLAMYLYEGLGGDRSQVQAVRWFRQAAERGLIDSQYNLGRIYELGADGVAANAGEAYKWYLIAGRAGDEQAQVDADRMAGELSAVVRRTARQAADAFEAPPLT
jgi:localization factor PodJL